MSYFHNVRNAVKAKIRWKKFLDRNGNKMPSETYMKYKSDSDFAGKTVLNLGCGKSTYAAKNVVNADLKPGYGVNVVWDFSKTPLPWKSGTFDFILANHVMEHIPNWFECFKEMARILKPGGIIEVWVPPVSSDSAFTYRDHINWIGMASFAGCATFKRSGTNLFAEDEKKDESFEEFKKLKIISHNHTPILTWWTIFAPQWLLSWYTEHLRNVISEEGFIFQKGGDND